MVQPAPAAVEVPRFRPTSQADLAQSGERTRIRNNLAAIRRLHLLETEQRPATVEDQQVLARWSGWGAVPGVFDERSSDLAAERAELLELLSSEEYQAARANTLNAHYTDADLVQGIWSGLRELGFEGGNVLEPGCGAGNFVGFAPTDTTVPTRMIGVEIDPTSAAIAQHLYPGTQVLTESFAQTIAPDGAFDGVIGNVPFGNFQLYDPRYNPSNESIHNHFIAKSLRMTKPGGVVALITSRWTMDAENTEFRNRVASTADLVGAVRLPLEAHAAAAGTRTVTDVLFLRRREQDRPPAPVEWGDLAEIAGPDALRVNRYFLDHPEHVVGHLGTRIGAYGPEVTVTAPTDGSTVQGFTEAVRSITARATSRGLTVPLPGPQWQPLELVGGRDASRDGMMEVDDEDRLTRIVDGVRVEIDPPLKNAAQELFALLRLRDAYLELVEAERTRPVGDEHIEDLRGRLNERYDTYTGRYGPINRFGYKSNGQRNVPRLGGLRQDLMASRVLALEKFDPTTQKATKVEIFGRRTIAPAEPPTRVETAADALAVSLDTYAEVRLEEIQRLMGGIGPDQARRELGTLVYTEPVTEDLVPASLYLSGDVRAKLRAAEAAARTDERFAANVQALREVVPVDLTPAEIEARLGATWIDASYVQQFARELLRADALTVRNPGGSLWTVSGGNPMSVLASHTWGTSRMPAQAILQNLLQNKAIRLTRTVQDSEGHERTTLDQEATEAAQTKAEEMAEEFASWAWADPDRARDLARVYNDRFNSLALCAYTGDHLTFPGLAQDFTPYPHQRAAIARVINEQSSLLAHGVGAGKTAEMVVSIMEMRRLGQARKPALVVPNHMLGQISQEFAQLYPQAKILVADKDMMSRRYRARFADLAASGDWDAIVFGHNQFKNLPLPNSERRAYEDRQIAGFESWIETAETDPDVPSRTVKQLERAKVQLQNRYKKLWSNVDAGSATLADCGIDAIVYDEAHEAKNALVRSNIQDAAKADPSWQAEDLMMKADYIRRQGGKLVFSTATPIANSVAEAYVVMRFLRPDLLHATGIYDFDQWASTFGEIVTEFEMKPEGGGFQQKDRFARFTNVPELLRAFHAFADVKLSGDLGLNLPELVYPVEQEGATVWSPGRETVVVPPSQELLEYMQELGKRAEDIRRGRPQERWSPAQQRDRPDNMLWVSSDGRAAATDLRLVGEQAAADTKMARVADQVARIWSEHRDDVYADPDTGRPEERTGSLQMVFCDLGTPSPDPAKYDAYADLRERLVAHGVPSEQIRFVHEAKNDKEKADLFASARDGRTQVIVGSTKKMGTGTNMQRRAVALHHVDCPWRPVDIEQREGRLVRQGNENARVHILSYVTEGSFDAYMWQTALRKLRFIEQIMRGTLDAREVEDVSNTAMSYAEVQALASGNPLMLEKVVAEKRVKKLERAFRNHHQGQAMLERTIAAGQREIANASAAIGVFDRALEQRVPTKGEAFGMRVEGVDFRRRTEAADALRNRLGRHLREVSSGRAPSDTPITLGTLGGFTLSALSYYGLDGALVTEVYVDCPSNRPGRYGVEHTLATSLTKSDLATSTGHGLVMSLEHALNRMEEQRAAAVEAIPRLEAEIAHARDNLGAPFARQEELAEALSHEAQLLNALGLPSRESGALLEGSDDGPYPNDAPGLEGAVEEAAAADAIRTATAPPAQHKDPSPPEATVQGPDEPRAEVSRGSSTWREEPTAEEVLSLAQSPPEPTHPQPSNTGPVSEPAASAEEPAGPQPAPAPQASPASETKSAASTNPDSSSHPPQAAEPEPAESAGGTEELRELAAASIGLLMIEAHHRAETEEELRAQLNGALEDLVERGAATTVVELVRNANHVDPEHALSREGYRSRAAVEGSEARKAMSSARPVRIEDNLAPGGTGVARHISGASRLALREALSRQGFTVNETDDEALLLNGDPDQRRQAWNAVLAEMDRVELTGDRPERLFEDQWQEVLRQGPPEVEIEPGLIVEEPPAQADPEAVPQENTTGSVQEAQTSAPENDLPPAPVDPIQASDAPDATARAAVRRLQAGFDLRRWPHERASVQEGIDYLVDAGLESQALDLIRDANRADPSGAWGREAQRGHLMWQGPGSQERALQGPVIRIDHDGQQNTVVRGTSKDDEQVKGLLKDLKFTWSRKQGFWYLQRRLNAHEQARRVSRLLAGLEELGRDRITETHWCDINRRALDQRRELSQEAIEALRPAVEKNAQSARQESRYREAITSIDAIHRGLVEQGHLSVGDAPGTGEKPFAELRTELVAEGRELALQLLERFNAIMASSDPDLTAAWTLYGELQIIAPPGDITDDKLARTRKGLTRRFEQADLAVPEEEPTPESQQALASSRTDEPTSKEEESVPEPEPEPSVVSADAQSERTPEAAQREHEEALQEGGSEHARGEEPEPDPYAGTPQAPPLRSTINISGAEPYTDRAMAERASWWVEQHGISQWDHSTTAAEMAALRSLPGDDLIALDHALHQVREHALADGPRASAQRYADLAGAAATVSERLGTDRLHLAQAAALAAEHAARLAATREYNQARLQGADPAQLARVEAGQQAVRYTGAEEAREISRAVATVVGRWAQTATSRQVRDSLAQGADVARVRQVWEQICHDGLDGGPGPAAARFDGFARAVGELNLRLEAEGAQLGRLASFATRHAARLAATQQAAAARSGGVQHQQAPKAQQQPPFQRHHRPGQDLGR